MALTVLPDMSRRRPARRRLVAAAATSLIVTAGALLLTHGGAAGSVKTSVFPQASAKGELTAALRQIETGHGVTLSLRLVATEHALAAFVGPGSRVPRPVLRAITHAQLVVQARALDGRELSRPADHGDEIEARIALLDYGAPVFEAIVAGHRAFVRARFDAILELLGQGTSARILRADEASLPSAARALLDGRWVTSTGSSFSVTRKARSVSPPSEVERSFSRILADAVMVMRAGSDHDGDHLRVALDARQLLGDVFSEFLGARLAGPSGAALLIAGAAGHDRPLVADAWVRDGKVTRITLDIGQLKALGNAGAARPRVLLDFRLSTGAPTIQVPAGATQLRARELVPLLALLSRLRSGR